jgi:predicted PurR-regulated permease PerM
MGRKLFAALIAILFVYISLPLLLPVMMGGIFAVLFMPALEKMESRKVPTFLGSALLTVLITMIILIPVGLMIFFGAKSGFQQLQAIRQMPPRAGGGDWIDGLIDSPHVTSFLDTITKWFPVNIDSLKDSAHDVVHSTALKLGDLLGQFLAALPGVILATAVTVVSLLFFLMDGRTLTHFLRRNTIFSVTQTDLLFDNLAGMCRSVVLATVASGVAQASIMTLGCLILGVPNVPIIAALIFAGSFIPVIGSTPVSIFVILQQFVLGNTQTGIAMIVVGFMVATVDNFVRPIFLKGTANLHPLVAFVAAFGGLQAFGFIGVFLGPIIAGLFTTSLRIALSPEDSPAHSTP